MTQGIHREEDIATEASRWRLKCSAPFLFPYNIVSESTMATEDNIKVI